MVARETSPPEDIARELRSGLEAMGLADLGLAGEEAVRRLEAYTGILLQEAIPQGFLGPREGDRILSRHVLESAALAPLLLPPRGQANRSDATVVDVGSGAGLPGMVLACLGWKVTIVESLTKRASFLRRTAEVLDVPVAVDADRAEDFGRSVYRESATAVVARALAEPPVALELCLPLAEIGGAVYLLATRDPDAEERIGTVAETLGGAVPRWEELSVPGADPPPCVMIVDKVQPTAERFPRRSGVPKQRPLG